MAKKDGHSRKDSQIVGNIGMYYVCYELSKRGWNAMPTARNAKGIDIIAYTPDGDGFLGIQVKTLSKRNPIPVGSTLGKVMGDYWVIVVNAAAESPDIFIFTPEEIKALAHKYGDHYWIDPPKYDVPEYRNVWKRLAPPRR